MIRTVMYYSYIRERSCNGLFVASSRQATASTPHTLCKRSLHMTNKSKLVYSIAMVALSIGLLGLLTGCLSDEKVIFEFGQEDKSYGEFRRRGLRDITEYRCRVGVDCSTEAFPVYLNRAGYLPKYAYGGVEHIIISFELNRSYNDVTLRLVRWGDETTVV